MKPALVGLVAITLVSVQDEIEIGRQANAQVRKQVPEVRDAPTAAYIRDMLIMRRAGWDGRGMVELFDILRREASRDPGTSEAFFSSHPPPRDRIARLQAAVAKQPGGTRDSQQFQSIKARLQRMPAPRRMPPH